MVVELNIHLGYCCVTLLHKKLQCGRASTKTYLEKHSQAQGHDYLLEKARQNIEDLKKLLAYNYEEGILCFRMPEQILPQVDLEYYKIEELKDELREVGAIANQYGIQLSTHPSQYFVLNSIREEVVNRTIHSLNLFAETMAVMVLDKVPNMTLHLGMKGGYETEDDAVRAFCRNYTKLGQAAKNYLVLENDHVSFTVDDCLKVHEEIGIPIVFDNKHYEWNQGKLGFDEALNLAVHTWKGRIPKLHLSSDKDDKKHAHADYVAYEDYKKMEDALMKTGIEECNVMLECKLKDLAVLQLKEEIQKK